MSECSNVRLHEKPGIIPQVLCRATNISSKAKIIFALLTTYKEAYPSQNWIADRTPCSLPTVRAGLKELELHGWIIRERRNRRDKKADFYHVYLSKPLPVSKRAKWVTEVGLSGAEISALKKEDYRNLFTENGLLREED